MPHHMDIHARTLAVLESANRILLRDGPSRLSLRAIAAETRISLGALTSHYENRRRLLQLLAVISAKQWVDLMGERVGRLGPIGTLPLGDEPLDRWTLWLMWSDIARSFDVVRGQVFNPWQEERNILWHWAGWKFAVESVELLLAAVHGLQRQVCAAFDPMPVARAHELLAVQVRAARAGPLRPEARGAVRGMVERSD